MSLPTPAYIFRGHKSSVNAITFFNNDKYIASSDADGIVCIWKMKTRRSILEWKAHEAACLQVHVYGNNKLISQGRDNAVYIWQLTLDEDNQVPEYKLIHSIEYYSLSFCRLSICQITDDTLLCLPLRGDTSLVDIYSIEQQKWVMQKIGMGDDDKHGLCMAVKLFYLMKELYILTGYEDGSVALWNVSYLNEKKSNLVWLVKEHTAPVLDVAVERNTFGFAISTSGDNQIVKYALSSQQQEEGHENNIVIKKSSIKKSGLAAIDIRIDGKIFATAGHDGRIRVFSCKSLQPLAILSYHRDSVYSVAFASVLEDAKDHWLIGGSKESRISLWKIY